MLRSTTYFGISMVSRKNRRLLVAATYIGLALMTAGIAVIPWTRFYVPAVLFCVLVTFVGWSSTVFHSVVAPTVIPRSKLTPLGLMRKRRLGDPDERDVAVMKAAHFEAYQWVVLYAIFACLYFLLRGVKVVPLVVFLPLVVFAPTLPLALILWNEDDVPEEARAEESSQLT